MLSELSAQAALCRCPAPPQAYVENETLPVLLLVLIYLVVIHRSN